MTDRTRLYLRALRRKLDYDRSVWQYACEYVRPTRETYDAMPPYWHELASVGPAEAMTPEDAATESLHVEMYLETRESV